VRATGGAPVRAVVFDVGETLVDETRTWTSWADWLEIPRLTALAMLGAAIARGEHHLAPFRLLRPDTDLRNEVRRRAEAGLPDDVIADDLYPDALPCLHALHLAGYRLGVVGNQPARAEGLFRALDVPLELVASSATWGVEKPDPLFFRGIGEELDLPPGEVAYVGDRVDNDVAPAAAAGLFAVFIRRGPWAWIQAGTDDPQSASLVIGTLEELPARLARLADPSGA
jgi:FMN phosphatase YigB (HAD superfamily)